MPGHARSHASPGAADTAAPAGRGRRAAAPAAHTAREPSRRRGRVRGPRGGPKPPHDLHPRPPFGPPPPPRTRAGRRGVRAWAAGAALCGEASPAGRASLSAPRSRSGAALLQAPPAGGRPAAAVGRTGIAGLCYPPPPARPGPVPPPRPRPLPNPPARRATEGGGDGARGQPTPQQSAADIRGGGGNGGNGGGGGISCRPFVVRLLARPRCVHRGAAGPRGRAAANHPRSDLDTAVNRLRHDVPRVQQKSCLASSKQDCD